MKAKDKQTFSIPEGWQYLPWSEICEICYGKEQKQIEDPNGEFGIYGTGGLMGMTNHFLYDKESVIIGRKGTIDKPYFLSKPFWTVDTAFFTKIIQGFDPKWFFYSVCNTPLKKYNEATGVPSLSRSSLYNIKTLAPTLPEQQKIAEILSTVDEKIEVIEDKISKTQELKKGLMQQLLTRGIGHTEFKDSPLGEIPLSWEFVKLSQLAKVKGRIGFRGYTKADLVKKGEGALTIGAKHITKYNKINFDDPEYISWAKYEESPEIKVAVGDLLIVQRGSLGKVALIEELPEPATINPSMVLLKGIKCNPKFLYYSLAGDQVQKEIGKITTSTAVPMISQSQINGFSIALPSSGEQDKIVEVLQTVDHKLNSLESRLEKLRNFKQGLMQQLLTGKIRVNSLLQKEILA